MIVRRLVAASLALLLTAPLGLPAGLATLGVDTASVQADWAWDLDRDKLDDGLSAAMARGDAPDPAPVFLHYVAFPPEAEAARLEALGAQAVYRFHALPSIRALVPLDAMQQVRDTPEVWGIEAIPAFEALLDISAQAIKARPSTLYPNGVWNALGYRGEGMVIAVLDTGVDETHLDLDDQDDDPSTVDPKFVAGADTSGSRPVDVNPVGDAAHGHHVAATALGTGATVDPLCNCRHIGVAPQARLVDVKIANGGSDVIGGIAAGFDWVLKYNAGLTLWGDPGEDRIDVATLSFGCNCHGAGGDFTSRVVNELVRSGVVVTIAAGNAGGSVDTLNFPGVADGAITVANSNDLNTVNRNDDVINAGSSRGPRPDDNDGDSFDELKPEIAAPGTNICAAAQNTGAGHICFTGTSMATPHVAGVAALMLQANPALVPVDKDRNPVKDILIQTATTKTGGAAVSGIGKFGRPWNNAWGYGLVDAFEAVKLARDTPAPALAVHANGPYRGFAGAPVDLLASVGGGTRPHTLGWDLDAGGAFDDAAGAVATITRPKGTWPVAVRAVDGAGAEATSSASVVVEQPVFYDDFEGPDKGWTTEALAQTPGGEATRWQPIDASRDFSWDEPTTGTRFWYAGLAGGQVTGAAYSQGADARLVSPLIDLRGVTGPATLHYDASGTVRVGDVLRAEVRRASETTWTVVGSHGFNRLGMEHHTADLTAYVGDQVQVRFRFLDDNTLLGILVCCFAGWYVDTVAVTVANVLPQARIGASSADVTDLEDVRFTDRSTDEGPLARLWDFGDGFTSTDANPVHRFADDGLYTVTLTVTDADGATDADSLVVRVRNVAPSAGFSFSPREPVAGQPVQFTDLSHDADGAVVQWHWTFGDGTSSPLANPVHVYVANGVYPVSLTATDDDGAASVAHGTVSVCGDDQKLVLSPTPGIAVAVSACVYLE